MSTDNTATCSKVPATLSDLFFNSKTAQEAFVTYCGSDENGWQGRTRIMEAASKFIDQLEAVGERITVTAEDLAADFIARL